MESDKAPKAQGDRDSVRGTVRHLRAYLRAMGSDWIGLMAGGFGLVVTIAGFYIPTKWNPVLFWAIGGIALLYVQYRAWRVEYKRAEDLAERLEPRLEFHRQPDIKPFFYEFVEPQTHARVRYLRIAVANRGGSDVRGRLVLESCEPGAADGVLPGLELQRMGQGADLDFPIGAHSEAVVDVAQEVVPEGQIYGAMTLCYANGIRVALPQSDAPYKITLRAEGAGPPVRCSLMLGGRKTWRLDGLTTL